MRRDLMAILLTAAAVFIGTHQPAFAQSDEVDEIGGGDLDAPEPPPGVDPGMEPGARRRAPSSMHQTEPVGSAQTVVGDFYGVLSPHGRWVPAPEVANGWVWVPHRHVVGNGFRPYATNGHWVHSDQGWMFVSDYNWGWVPFHYGRWFRHRAYGWVWAPGHRWAPAWVEWRHGDGMVGWAPMPPDGYGLAEASWVFVDGVNLVRPRVASYFLPRVRWRRAYRRTVVYRRPRGYYWSRGPAPVRLGVRVGRTVRVAPPRAGVVARVSLSGNRTVFRRHGRVRHVVRPARVRHRRHVVRTRVEGPRVVRGGRRVRVAPARRGGRVVVRGRRGVVQSDDDDDQGGPGVRRRRRRPHVEGGSSGGGPRRVRVRRRRAPRR